MPPRNAAATAKPIRSFERLRNLAGVRWVTGFLAMVPVAVTASMPPPVKRFNSKAAKCEVLNSPPFSIADGVALKTGRPITAV